MGVLARSLRALSPDNDAYYTSAVPMWSLAGINVDAGAAMRISTVFACRRIIAETVGSLPCVVYRQRPDSGKERATDHPLYDVLHDQPNSEQTSMEYFELLTGWAALRGTGRSEIIPGPRGAVDQLIPIPPDRIKPERVNGSFGGLTFGSAMRYKVTEPDGLNYRYLTSEQVFSLRGISDDGIQGMSVLNLARDSFGVALAAEQHAARTFGSAPRPAGTLEYPGTLSDPAFERLQKQIAQHSGAGAERALILEGGMKWNSIGMTNADAEFLASRQFSIAEICRWFRVPPHMVADLERATYNNIEFQGIEFVIYTMLPWLRRWEQAIQRDLIVAKQSYFVEFLVQGLLRGDTKSRFEAYAIARQWGWMSVNDIRRLENANPVPGGDTYLTPLNMVPSGTGQVPGAYAPQTPSGRKMLGLLGHDAAARVLRKEIAAMRKLAARDEAEWNVGVRAFYSEHATYVARELHMDLAEADSWVERQRDELLADGPAVLERWEVERSDVLAEIALRGQETAA